MDVSRRVQRAGKFLCVGDQKLYLKGVTYGTFELSDDGTERFDLGRVEADFAAMRDAGMNAVRLYTTPPRWVLDCAARAGLQVLVGLPWEQHVAFLDSRRQADAIVQRVREAARTCAGHPALLGFAVGNEIPAPIVRWYGARRVERFIERLYRAVKEVDQEALVTYVNYPTTEYLSLPFLDFVCFNVYLEDRDRFEAYLARLQNIAGERPLVLAEVGLDSRCNGEAAQAQSIDWQLDAAFAGGGAGAFVFAWTDEWYRGGIEITDWDFGLTTRDRRPKPALEAVSRRFAAIPFDRTEWPLVSVVVCTYNGARTIRDCMEGLAKLEYPNFEVIVVNDGSTDGTLSIVEQYPVRIISSENRGLGSARNTGMDAANGEYIAYTDDDARPDPHWLHYIVSTFEKGSYAIVGGPNIAPAGDGPIAECVAHSPGGPIHVLRTDTDAEHVPGCNLVFRAEALRAVGGFDPRYRAAGDDVDVCWRIEANGGTIGFSHGGMVWHHRRNSARMYWRQQQGYGRAEALLEAKWPSRYNAAGHVRWGGQLYGNGLNLPLGAGRGRVFGGVYGSAPYQSVYEPGPGLLRSLSLMPEWLLMVLCLGGLSLLAIDWRPLVVALPLAVLAAAVPVLQAAAAARRAQFRRGSEHQWGRFRLRVMTFWLHLLQPVARLKGRAKSGLVPWRVRGARRPALPRSWSARIWSEEWRPTGEWPAQIGERLGDIGAVVVGTGDFDRWDMYVRGGLGGGARIRTTVEEHGQGRQLVRIHVRPAFALIPLAVALVLGGLAAAAAADSAWVATAVMALGAAALVVRETLEVGRAMANARRAIRSIPGFLGSERALSGGAATTVPTVQHTAEGTASSVVRTEGQRE